jgi:hypothetical protein
VKATFGQYLDVTLRARAIEEERREHAMRLATMSHPEETISLLLQVCTSYTYYDYQVEEPTAKEQETIDDIHDAILRLRRVVLSAVERHPGVSLRDIVASLNIIRASKSWARFETARNHDPLIEIDDAPRASPENEALLSILENSLEPPEERTHIGELDNGKAGAA